jgi:hypothetical protein
MSLTKYDGICFICGKQVKAGKGDFQSTGSLPKSWRNKIKGKWLVRGFECKNLGNRPMESSPFFEIINNK